MVGWDEGDIEGEVCDFSKDREGEVGGEGGVREGEGKEMVEGGGRGGGRKEEG